MNKKLIAVAVAGALAVPGIALAQSSVTISGQLKISLDNVNIGNRAAGSVGNSSEMRVADDSSRIIFGVKEDLGNGLAAVGQVDMRMALDTGSLGASGNTFVGLKSSTMGQLTVGRHDLHYFNRESYLTGKAASLKADSISILAFAGGGGVAIANATRTPNSIKWTSPNWGGFTLIGAYSTNPTGSTEADIGSTVRKGDGWNLNPNFKGSNFQVGYSYWKAKPDAVVLDQRGDRVYGSIRWQGFHVGAAWDKSTLTDSTGSKISDRNAWSIPIEYSTGPHNIYFHYDKANKDKGTAFSGGPDSSAKMIALAYVYDLSKRTSVGVTYAKIDNAEGAMYNFFTTTGGIGSPDTAVTFGEDPRLIAVTVRHGF
jgi:predicted porin